MDCNCCGESPIGDHFRDVEPNDHEKLNDNNRATPEENAASNDGDQSRPKTDASSDAVTETDSGAGR